jgi:hypothetical protein
MLIGSTAAATSTTATSFTSTTLPGTDNLCVCWCQGLNRVVIVGQNSAVYTSNDLTNWTSGTSQSGTYNDIIWVSELGLLVAVGDSDVIMTSPDTVTWTTRTITAAEGANWECISYDGTNLVALASTGTNRLVYSADGITWTLSSSADDTEPWYDILWIKEYQIFLAASSTTIATATAYNSWTTLTTGLNACTSAGVVWAVDIGRMSVGRNVSTQFYTTDANLEFSMDVIHKGVEILELNSETSKLNTPLEINSIDSQAFVVKNDTISMFTIDSALKQVTLGPDTTINAFGDAFTIQTNGIQRMLISSENIVSYEHLVPSTDNTYDLGTGSNQWRNVYAYTGSFGYSYVGDGNVSNPSVSFTSDTDTGLYNHASDVLGFSAGGDQAMLIDSSGTHNKVLIGDYSDSGSATLAPTLQQGTGFEYRRYVSGLAQSTTRTFTFTVTYITSSNWYPGTMTVEVSSCKTDNTVFGIRRHVAAVQKNSAQTATNFTTLENINAGTACTISFTSTGVATTFQADFTTPATAGTYGVDVRISCNSCEWYISDVSDA